MLKKIGSSLASFFELQLFLTLISWPILIAWGLPFSLLAPVGNYIFNPLLIMFIFLGSLYMATELLYLPNGYLVHPLEWLTTLWNWCLSWGQDSFLLYFPEPPTVVLFLLPLSAVAIVIKTKKQVTRILLFMGMIALFGLAMHHPGTHKKEWRSVNYGSKAVSLYTDNTYTTILLPQGIKPSRSFSQWVQYTLIPTIIRNTGSRKVSVILEKESKNLHACAQVIASQLCCLQVSVAPQFCTTQLRADQTD